MVEIKRVGINRKGMVSLQDLLNLARGNPEVEKGGAVATFTGIVRGYTQEGKEVHKLEIEAYEEEANRALTRISKEVSAKLGVIEVLICHLVGEFCVGEDLGYVVVIGKSRRDTFQALEEAVERYKKEVAIWKKEYLKDGSSSWVTQ